jgi:hypothetical protein
MVVGGNRFADGIGLKDCNKLTPQDLAAGIEVGDVANNQVPVSDRDV